MPRLALSALGIALGLAIHAEPLEGVWAGVFDRFAHAVGDSTAHVETRLCDGRILQGYVTLVHRPGSTNWQDVLLVWNTRCTYLQVALGIWPLLVRRWRLGPVLRAALWAVLITAMVNLGRLYVLAWLALRWDATWKAAHDIPNWVAMGGAFAVGLACMYNGLRRESERGALQRARAAQAVTP